LTGARAAEIGFANAALPDMEAAIDHTIADGLDRAIVMNGAVIESGRPERKLRSKGRAADATLRKLLPCRAQADWEGRATPVSVRSDRAENAAQTQGDVQMHITRCATRGSAGPPTHVDWANAEAHGTDVDAVEVNQTLQRRSERSRVVIARGFDRAVRA